MVVILLNKMLVINNFTSYLFHIFVGCLIVYYVIFIVNNWRLIKFSWNHKGFFLPILPVIGTSYLGLLVAINNRLPVNLLSTVEWTKKYIGIPFNFWLGTTYCYGTNNPEEIKIIFNHPMCYNKGKAYEILSLVFPESIAVVPSDRWKVKRKYFQNSYKPAVLKSFVPTFYKQCCNLLEDIDSLNNSKSLFDTLSEYSFVNFFLTSAGLNEEKCYPDLRKIGSIIGRIQNDLISRLLDPVVPLNTWLKFFPSGQQFTKNRNELMGIIRSLIKQKYQHDLNGEVYSANDKAMPLFDLIVNVVAKNMDENEIFDEFTFFTLAATETSGNALTFCFLLLGMHPEIQETLYREVIDKVGQNDISSDDLPNLKYTEAVINETLRIFPSVPLIQRYIGVDVDVGTQVIPKGVNFSADIFHLHRDEKYWPNPLKFDPTRFLPENASKIKPYTFLPFAGGPRDCLGKAQAMSVMKTTVADVVRKVKITSSHKSIEEIELTSFVTMKAVHPINCQFSLRLVD